MDMGDSPMEVPETSKDHVMHSILTLENITIMASDTMPGQTITFGNSVSLSINCTSREQADRFFNNLKANGSILMPLQDTFWGAYFGMITDQFGINWLFNYDEVK
jgi:PhnB protein